MNIAQKKVDNRYVSVFADSTPDVDITFRLAFLKFSSENYKVGVDDLTISLSNLGLLDPTTNLILEITTRHDVGNQHNIPVFESPTNKGKFRLQDFPQTILSINEFMMQLSRFGGVVSDLIEGGLSVAGGYPIDYVSGTSSNTRHLGFYLNPDGRLVITGSKIFWMCFQIRFPNKRYQEIFGFDEEYLSLDPAGNRIKNPNTHSADGTAYSVNEFDAVSFAAFQKVNINTTFQNDVNLPDHTARTIIDNFQLVVLSNCVLSSLDRRVALEMSCSLPVVNSPMIDHNSESPDFVLGRWMFPRNNQSEVECGAAFQGTRSTIRMVQKDHAGVINFQGPRDRILYHTLRPQEHIQTVRIRLYARIRQYNEGTESWYMQTIVLPTSETDWWHARLHFLTDK